jgi:peptide chain release factor subunit 3
MLAKSFGVAKLIVIVNKMDDSSVNWSQERYEQIKKDITPYLENTCKFNMEKEVAWVPISGLAGENILNAVSAERAPWYSGPSLFQIFDALPEPPRSREDPLRIPIIDKIKDQGLTIYGKIESGLAVKGLKVILMPIRAKGEIVEIIGGEDTKMLYATPGENIKMRIKVAEEIDVQRGYVICDVHSVCHTGNEFKADVQFLDLPDTKMLITAGYRCVIHLHTAIEECEVSEVIALYDMEKKKKVKTMFSRSNQRVIIKIKTTNEVCLENYTTIQQLGRFVLRDKGITVALGKIIEFTEEAEAEEPAGN